MTEWCDGGSMVDVRLLAKSRDLEEPYPVIAHLVDTAMVCGALWDQTLTAVQRARIAEGLQTEEKEARTLVMTWAGLHDLGKIMPRFQRMITRERSEQRVLLGEPSFAHDWSVETSKTVRHEFATSRVIPLHMAELGYPCKGGPVAGLLTAQLAQILGGHHGKYPTGVEPADLVDPLRNMPDLGKGAWAAERRAHVTALQDVLGAAPATSRKKLPVELAVLVTGLVIVSDWVASQEHLIEAQQAAVGKDMSPLREPRGQRAHARRMAAAAPVHIRDAGLGQARFAPQSFRDMFPEITTPYPLQASVEAGLMDAVRGPGILLVTAPTGEGKTETALYAAALMGAACGSSGLFFALPTQATANQMYERVSRWARANLVQDAALTLLHGNADLYASYAEPGTAALVAPPEWDEATEPRVLSEHADEPGTGSEAVSVTAGRWLRCRGRGILSPLAVGTVDQALMGVLPLRWNALRHLGLSGKTVVIDEAHAYDTFTHALLLRLLHWLGALKVPVVLLSATLTGESARGLLAAYLEGAGHHSGSYELPPPAYPGWIYADAQDANFVVPAEPVGSGRERELRLDVHPVNHSYAPDVEDGRLATLLRLVEGATAGGGCVAVICTTVAESQRTYEALLTHYRERFTSAYAGWDDRNTADAASEASEAGPRLRLLHSRFPSDRRGGITAEAEGWFGRSDKAGVRRPRGGRAAVLVATQVIEQSLDFDFDLVISDLAPMAMLLQRAGRVWRHAVNNALRPPWASAPRLSVLAPVDDKGKLAVPVEWGEVYSPSLLQRTLETLLERGRNPVRVPGDVQGLVDKVYDLEFASADPDTLLRRDLERMAGDMAHTGIAKLVMLPPPRDVATLHTLTDSDADPDLVATRLGVESVPVLPVFVNEEGRWLDAEATIPLPERGSGAKGRFTRAEVRRLLGLVAPLPHGKWRAACTKASEPPRAWRTEPRLGRVVLIPLRLSGPGTHEAAMLDEYEISYAHELGMVLRRRLGA
ncbi:CRISPR-associated endonuclease Cas3'' [Streptomyces sp. ISL-99]|uniref:CRISPR-associated endonuclease Cas3'' n=1 Tax=Streptomyces sp. ISL-99 TaxID=2819193 RepID=UPI001BE5DF16|nr:CRISPR-associated endonuclease Cas3'' [Streptomyces sp. ISL-99]MBT2526318.1 CRISPR-associated endonuclease Cas3'' [Streptomyces sp. ISL-99]